MTKKRKSFPLDHYRYFKNPLTNTIYAVTTYAGKTVRAQAKCHTDDTPNDEIGKKLAGMRCGCKVNERRLKFATIQATLAKEAFLEAEREFHKRMQILNEIQETFYNDRQTLKEFVQSLNS